MDLFMVDTDESILSNTDTDKKQLPTDHSDTL